MIFHNYYITITLKFFKHATHIIINQNFIQNLSKIINFLIKKSQKSQKNKRIHELEKNEKLTSCSKNKVVDREGWIAGKQSFIVQRRIYGSTLR